MELGAAVFGMEYFHPYLIGRRFDLLTDHTPIVPLSTVHTKTLNRLQLKIQDMHPDIGYIPGKQNVVSDFLSRYDGMGISKENLTQQSHMTPSSYANKGMSSVTTSKRSSTHYPKTTMAIITDHSELRLSFSIKGAWRHCHPSGKASLTQINSIPSPQPHSFLQSSRKRTILKLLAMGAHFERQNALGKSSGGPRSTKMLENI